MTNFKY